VEDDVSAFRSSNGSRTHSGRPVNHSPIVALTLRQDRRHLWQAKQATLHLRHNDRVKKGVPHHSISYPFHFLFLSLLPQGLGKGILRKGSFSTKEAGPEPPY
jgi:hypothetical protein